MTILSSVTKEYEAHIELQSQHKLRQVQNHICNIVTLAKNYKDHTDPKFLELALEAIEEIGNKALVVVA